MLSYIIPPIVIILSLAWLIFFLFGKISKTSSGNLDFLKDDKNLEEKKNIRGKFLDLLGQFWLKVLEKIMQKTKLFSLKLHNASNSWFQSIRKKREKNNVPRDNSIETAKIISKNEKELARIPEKEEELQNVKSGMKKFTMDNLIPKRILKKRINDAGENIQSKNRLEDALIKRIAVNPKDIEAYERLGDYYMDMTNYKDASECYKQVLKLSPNHFKAKSKLRSIERILKI